MRFSSWWPPDLSQSGVLSWPSLVARVSSSLGMVAASFSTPSGLHFLTLRFLQIPWGSWLGARLSTQVSQSIKYKELFPIVMAAYLWGPLRASKQVNFLSDNCSVMEILRSATSRAPTIMSLGHYLSLLAARHSFSFTASPVRGKSNPMADSLSHFQFQRFRRLASHADSILTQIPQQLFSDLELRCQINASSTWFRILPLLLGKFVLLPNAASWISVLRKIAFLLRDQLFQPVKTCSSISAVVLPILSTIHW